MQTTFEWGLSLKKQISALLLASLSLTGLIYVSSQQAYAHSFSGDESAAFLTTIEHIKVQMGLVQSNLPSNVTLSQQAAEHALEHLDESTIEEISERNQRLGTDLPASLQDLHDSVGNSTADEINEKVRNIDSLLGEVVTVRIERDQLTNSTVQALVLANMADSVLQSYAEAYGIETEDGHGNATGHQESEMSNTTDDNGSMNMSEGGSMSMSGEDGNDTMQMGEENGTGSNMTMGEEHTTIVNMAEYQTAQGLAIRMQQFFDETLRELAPANATGAVTDLEAGIDNLRQAIDAEEPNDNVQVIVHTEVHPNIQKAYNLQIIPEFPLPMLMMIPAIAGIIAATRAKMLGRRK